MEWKLGLSVLSVFIGLILIAIFLPRAVSDFSSEEKISSKYHVNIMDENTIMLNSFTYPYDTIILKMDAYKMIGEYIITVEQ